MNFNFNNFLGQNELVTNSSINRALQRIFKIQNRLLNLQKIQVDPRIIDQTIVLNKPWTPTPTPTPSSTPIIPTTPSTPSPTPTPVPLNMRDIIVVGPGPVNLKTLYDAAGGDNISETIIRFIVDTDVGSTNPNVPAINTGFWTTTIAKNKSIILVVREGRFVAGARGIGGLCTPNPNIGTTGGQGGNSLQVNVNLNISIGSQNGGSNSFNTGYGLGKFVGGGGGGGNVSVQCSWFNFGCPAAGAGAGWDGFQVAGPQNGGYIDCSATGVRVYAGNGGNFGLRGTPASSGIESKGGNGASGGSSGIVISSGYQIFYI